MAIPSARQTPEASNPNPEPRIAASHESRKNHGGFSLVEVSIAIGVLAVVLLSVVGLLSIGIKSNRISVEETRAASILTMMETDLRNSYPASNTSAIFQLPLPYATNSSGIIFNPAITPGSLFSSALNDAERPTDFSVNPRSRYQASVVYLNVPASGQLLPITARLIVNWPATNTADASDLTSPAKVSGSVESIVSFPAP